MKTLNKNVSLLLQANHSIPLFSQIIFCMFYCCCVFRLTNKLLQSINKNPSTTTIDDEALLCTFIQQLLRNMRRNKKPSASDKYITHKNISVIVSLFILCIYLYIVSLYLSFSHSLVFHKGATWIACNNYYWKSLKWIYNNYKLLFWYAFDNIHLYNNNNTTTIHP